MTASDFPKTARTVAATSDSVDYLLNGQVYARLYSANKITAIRLAQYSEAWHERAIWPLAASREPWMVQP